MASGGESSVNYAEYLVVREKDSYIRRIKFLSWLAALLLLAVISVLVLVVVKMPTLVVLGLFSAWALRWYLSRYERIEYEYVIASATFRMEAVLAQRTRKLLCEVMLRDFVRVVPYAENTQVWDSIDSSRRVFAASSYKSPDLYIGVYRDSDGCDSAVLFEATNKALSIFRFYNASATTVKPVRY